ncbi:MAG TPA: helix-turn-helix transcriptional regulator [Xanthobacteraceae bacterium]|nr:helix-turn-helix transcriptional regulator [Xanthobacteraceae bacterium]
MLTSLVEDIYDAAIDSARWADVLAKVVDFVGGQAGGIVSKGSAGKSGNAHYHFGMNDRYLQLYAETYWKFDPVAASSICQLKQVVSVPDLVPYDEFRGGRFYHEWVRPQGWVDAANVVLEKSATDCVYLSVIRGESRGMVDGEMRGRVASLVPHLRRAMRIGKALDRKKLEAKTFAETLDGLSVGLFFVDAEARVVHANTAAQDILGANDFLRAMNGRLVARDLQFDQALREVFAAAERGDAGSGAKVVALPLHARDGEHYVAHLMPLAAGARRRPGAAYAAAAVFVHRAALESPSLSGAIAQTYQLTPAEFRVLHAIVEEGGISEVAHALGIAATTVKTHLRHIFEKTGAGRQVDLVKLVAGFSSPLAG